jgi:lambda repressor-like predicted transcriptional regulator
MLPPPTPPELAWLAQQARVFNHAAAPQQCPQTPSRSGRLRRRLTAETVSELARRYRGGESSTALSREYGVSKSGLIQLLRTEGVEMRKQYITPDATEMAIRLYESGLSTRKVSKEVGYAWGTIRKVLLQNGVPLRTRPGFEHDDSSGEDR